MKEITFELTNKCFNKCLHCSSYADPNRVDILDIGVIKDTIDKYNPEYVNISGGEPMLYLRVYELLEYLNRKNIKVNLYTSGYGYSIAEIENISSYKYAINTIVFPVHSDRRNIFNFMADTNSYSETMLSIDAALKFNMNVSIHIVPTTVNIYSLDDTIQYLISIGIKEIKLLKLVNQGRCFNNQYLILDDRILKEQINYLFKKYYDVVKIGLPFSSGKCTAGIDKLVMLANGIIIPCESYKDGYSKCKRI